MPIKVLHLGDEKNWRGGENQIRFLVENSEEGFEHHIAYPKGSRAIAEFSKITSNVLALPSRRGVRNVLKLISYCRKHKIDIIDAHSASAHRQALMVKRFYPFVKLVVHRRVSFAIKKNFLSRSKYFSLLVDHYVAISKDIAKVLKDYGIKEEKITVIPSAVSEEKYLSLDRRSIREKMSKELPLDNKLLWIGNASAFTKEKGYDVLIRALAILKEKGHSFHALLAGDGPLLDEMKKKVSDLGLSDSVVFLGHIKNVEEFLLALDILAFPTENEGLGTLVQDAIYAGCAVSATNVGGVPEMIKDNETGLLNEVGDEKALSDNLAKLLDNDSLRERLNSEAKKRLREGFSVENMVKGNLTLYRNLVKR